MELVQDPKDAHHHPDDEENGSNVILHLISLVNER